VQRNFAGEISLGNERHSHEKPFYVGSSPPKQEEEEEERKEKKKKKRPKLWIL